MVVVNPEGAIGMKVKWKLYIARIVPAVMVAAALMSRVGTHATSVKW